MSLFLLGLQYWNIYKLESRRRHLALSESTVEDLTYKMGKLALLSVMNICLREVYNGPTH